MPPLPVALTIETALPRLSPAGRAAINTLAAARGPIPKVDEMATRLGLQSRYQVARLLRREGLPSFSELTDWMCLLSFLWQAESSSRPLLQLVQSAGMDPATCYRRCKRTLGVPWSVARRRGFAWALVRFLKRCGSPSRHPLPAVPSPAPPGGSRGLPIGRPGDGPAIIGLGRQGPALRRDSRQAGGFNGRHPRGTLAARLSLHNAPTDVAVAPTGAVFATRAYAARVERLDLAGLKPVASVPVGCNPTRLALDRSGRRAYVSNQFSDSISVIDVLTNRCIDTIPVQGNPAPVVLSADERTLFVTTNADRLYAIDVAAKRVVASIPLPATSHHLTLHPSAARLYVATRAAGTVIEIDTRTWQHARTFAVGGQTQALAVSADGAELYIANETGGLDVVDLEGGTFAASLQLQGRAYGLALSPDNGQLYVGLVSSGRVQVVDRESLRVIRSIVIGGLPRGIVFSPLGDTALVANEAGWVDVIT
jgi:YVTN family beta-propeller protein